GQAWTRTVRVPVTTLDALVARHGLPTFIKIDVEGFEAEVIRGGDFRRWRPRVVLVEATKPNTTIPSHEEWEKVLLDAGYVFAYFDGLNRFYLRPEDQELQKHFEIPVNVFDDYQPFEYVRQIRLLDETRKDLNNKLITETALRGACEKTLNSVWTDHNQVNERLGQLAAQYQQLLKVMESLAGPLTGLEQIGPLSFGLARRMAAGAKRFPSAARFIRFGLRSAISLKKKLKRSV
ncbi:MAG: FkbM family methyltransferase, partial [Actinomycetota bacterium]